MIVKIHDCDSPDILPTSYRKYVDCGSVGMQNIGDTYILKLIDYSTNSTWTGNTAPVKDRSRK